MDEIPESEEASASAADVSSLAEELGHSDLEIQDALSSGSCPALGAENTLVTGEALETAIQEVMALGYHRDQVLIAMKASCNNPDRAVEYLLSGRNAVSADESDVAAVNHGSNEALDLKLVPEDSTLEAGDPLILFASQPQFHQIRQMLNSRPELLKSFLQRVRCSNPRLHKAISENRERFLQTLNEPIAADFGAGVPGGGTPAASGSVILSQSEHQAVERLMALGFSESFCVQAYFACEKNEDFAANFLLSQDCDDLN